MALAVSRLDLLISRHGNFNLQRSPPNFFHISEIMRGSTRSKSGTTTCCLQGVTGTHGIQTASSKATFLLQLNSSSPPNAHKLSTDVTNLSCAVSDQLQRIVLVADLDPATAKLAIGIIGPLLSAFSFLFILRIIMSWYPKLPVGKFPYVIAYAPTEPLLSPTRKLIPPLGGVDVTPVVWFGLVSFLSEILVGPQGLLVLLSQQI
eukprot:TRINITY_DN1753_c0_g3_i1.p1 TRINITY_DN1753_c0_g3~~TRINITY_DN1753_c0_g3_i1.p1  ORF type:complete len:217 (+),score=8.34 TRINITY_DN1753_c0_g3_i1:37-651(+)